MVDTNGHDWNELKHGKIKRILYTELPMNAFYNPSEYYEPGDPMQKLNELVDLIMTEVRLYANKLEDQVCKDHHDSH